MYKIENSTVYAAVTSYCRTFRAKIDFTDENGHPLRTLSGQDVGHVTIEHAQTESDTLQIGGVLSKKVQFQICCGYLPQRGDVMRLYLYLLDTDGASAEPTTQTTLGQWTHRELAAYTHRQITHLPPTKDLDGVPLEDYYIPFGEFVVRRAAVDGCLIRVTAYDKLFDADQPYIPTIQFPASSVDVAEDVMHQLGIRYRKPVDTGNLVEQGGENVLGSDTQEILVSAEYSFAIEESEVEGKTCREVLGGIAAMSGGNALLDRDGRLTVGFVDSTWAGLDKNTIYTPEVGDKDQTIPGLRCIVDDEETLTMGEPDKDGTVEFVCPWMTSHRLWELWFYDLVHILWRPAVVNERLGNPTHDLGDRLEYTLPAAAGLPQIGCRLLLTSIRYEFDGGLSAELTSCGTMEVI